MSDPRYTDLRYVVSLLNWWTIDRFVEFALTRNGFGNSNSGTRVTYPDGDSDTRHIPLRSVEMRATFWTPAFIVAETKYLQSVADKFRHESHVEAADEIEDFIKRLPSLPAKAYMPVPKLFDALLRTFSVDDIVTFSLTRTTFRDGKYGYGVRYYGDEVVPGYRKNITVLQYHGPGATLLEDRYLSDLRAVLLGRGEAEAAAKIEAFRTRNAATRPPEESPAGAG